MTQTITLQEKTKFISEAIENLQNQNKTFCEGIGKIAGEGSDLAISKIPQLKFLNTPITKELLPRLVEAGTTKLCNKFMDGLNAGKYCSVPLTAGQKQMALDLLNGKVDDFYIQQCKPSDLKTAAQAVEKYTKSNEYNSINRHTEAKLTNTVNDPNFEIPKEYQEQKQAEEVLLINNSPKDANTFFDKVGKAVIFINQVIYA